jgi:uncharacterized protein YbcV (DUF1398 family)
MNPQAIRETLVESHEGKLIFPEVVIRMLAAGVESYFVDFLRSEDIVYLNDNTTLVEKTHFSHDPIVTEFSKPAIVAAIRAAQRDEIRYPDFVRQSVAAGVVGYWAFLIGKKVIYFGRKGEFHVEEFPGSQPVAVSATHSHSL